MQKNENFNYIDVDACIDAARHQRNDAMGAMISGGLQTFRDWLGERMHHSTPVAPLGKPPGSLAT